MYKTKNEIHLWKHVCSFVDLLNYHSGNMLSCSSSRDGSPGSALLSVTVLDKLLQHHWRMSQIQCQYRTVVACTESRGSSVYFWFTYFKVKTLKLFLTCSQTPSSWAEETRGRRSASGHKRSASWGSAEHLREASDVPANKWNTPPLYITFFWTKKENILLLVK